MSALLGSLRTPRNAGNHALHAGSLRTHQYHAHEALKPTVCMFILQAAEVQEHGR